MCVNIICILKMYETNKFTQLNRGDYYYYYKLLYQIITCKGIYDWIHFLDLN